MKNVKYYPGMCYQCTLKKNYELNQRWIDQIGEPDLVVANPHYPRKLAFLYSTKRIEDFLEMHDSEYRDYLDKKHRRRNARTSAFNPYLRHNHLSEIETALISEWNERTPKQESKQNPPHNFVDWVDKLAIELTVPFPQDLDLDKDCRQYLKRNHRQVKQITQNDRFDYLMHEHTNYKLLLTEFQQKAVGKPVELRNAGYRRLRTRIKSSIEACLIQ